MDMCQTFFFLCVIQISFVKGLTWRLTLERQQLNSSSNNSEKEIPSNLSSDSFQITAHLVDNEEKVSHGALRSLLLSGSIPVGFVLYPPAAGNYTDSGENQLKIYGMYKESNSSQYKLTEPSVFYPLPNIEIMDTVYFNIPAISFGSIVLPPVRKAFHIFGSMMKQSENLLASSTFEQKWLPNMPSYYSLMGFLVAENEMALSSDEFETFHVVKDFFLNFQDFLPQSRNMREQCTDAVNVVLPVGRMVHYFSKAGSFIIQINVGKQSYEIFTFGSDFDCINRVTFVPPLLSSLHIFVSSRHKLFHTSSSANETLRELKDSSNISACEFAMLTEENCKIIDQTYDTTACCMAYILVEDLSNHFYILLRYKGLNADWLRGQWLFLRQFYKVLPAVESGIDEPMILSSNKQYQGRSLQIIGINTLSTSDATIYLWGSVLLAYDIRSGVLGWIHSFLPASNLEFVDDIAIQFSFAKMKGLYSILTKKRSIWLGFSSPFSRASFQQIIQVPFQKTADALFFDSYDSLFALSMEESNQVTGRYSLVRHKVRIPTDVQVLRGMEFNCVPVSTECNTKRCGHHSLYSRIGKFVLKPPLKSPMNFGSDVVQTDEKTMPPYHIQFGFETSKSQSIDTDGRRKYEDYLLVSNVQSQDIGKHSSRDYYHAVRIHSNDKNSADEHSWGLPSVVYLDRGQQFRFNVTILITVNAKRCIKVGEPLTLAVSDNEAVSVESEIYYAPFSVIYEIVIAGKKRPHNPPGKLLTTVSVTLYVLNTPDTFCCDVNCSRFRNWNANEHLMLVKVGCPPAQHLKFDTKRSLEILHDRGRTDDFQCLYETNDDVPCFTTSEFVAAFYVEDIVTGESSPFVGKYTLQMVGGGVNTIKEYTKDEVTSYNYRPGDSKSLLSLIWSVINETASESMQDNATGKLIFDAKNPAGIVFECRLNSPCGNIPFGASNPAEFYLLIEVSNKGVDDSTNCDYTTRFKIHLIGVELNPKVHLMIMVVTLSVIVFAALSYYIFYFDGGPNVFRKGIVDDESDESAVPPPEFYEKYARRFTISQIQSGNTRRTSVIAQSLIAEADSNLAQKIKG